MHETLGLQVGGRRGDAARVGVDAAVARVSHIGLVYRLIIDLLQIHSVRRKELHQLSVTKRKKSERANERLPVIEDDVERIWFAVSVTSSAAVVGRQGAEGLLALLPTNTNTIATETGAGGICRRARRTVVVELHVRLVSTRVRLALTKTHPIITAISNVRVVVVVVAR